MLEDKPVLKKVGIGCLVAFAILALILTVGGIKIYFDVKKAGGVDKYVNQKSAEELQYRVNVALDSLPLNTPEKQTISAPVARLAERMASGGISPAQSNLIVARTFQSPALEVLIALLFQNRHVDAKDDAARLTLNRFNNGLLDGKISAADAAPVLQLILVDASVLPEIRRSGDLLKQELTQKMQFKNTVSVEDRNKCLELMKAAADRAAVPPARRDLNFTPVLEKIITQATAAPQK